MRELYDLTDDEFDEFCRLWDEENPGATARLIEDLKEA